MVSDLQIFKIQNSLFNTFILLSFSYNFIKIPNSDYYLDTAASLNKIAIFTILSFFAPYATAI